MAVKIPLEGIESSTLCAMGYDSTRQILALQFVNKKAIRHYAGVPPGVATAMYCATSKGTFFNREIKGQYQVEPMTGDCPKCGDHGWIGETCADCGCAEYSPAAMPVLHFVFHDEPSATSKKLQHAACGAWVSPREVARVVAPTCPECLARRDQFDKGGAF